MPRTWQWRMTALAMGIILVLPVTMPLSVADVQVDILDTGQSGATTFYGVCWKRDGSQAIIVGDDSTVLTFSHASKKFERFEAAGLPAFLFSASWRPDSLYALIVGADGAVLSFNGETLAPYCTTRSSYFRCVDWKSDSSEALMVGSGGTILRFQDGIFQPVASGTAVDLFSCSWNPRTGTALISGANSTILRLETTGSVTKIPFEGDQSLYAVSWNPDGSEAMVVGGNGVVAIFDGTKTTIINSGTLNNFLGCCWRPGAGEAYISGDAGVILKYAGGKLTWVVTGLGSQLYGIRFRTQGDYLLSAGYLAKVARYPKAPKPAGVCLLENPLVIAAMVLISVGVIIAYIAKDRLDKRPSLPGPEGSRRTMLKKKR